jgi:hypothetical protein
MEGTFSYVYHLYLTVTCFPFGLAGVESSCQWAFDCSGLQAPSPTHLQFPAFTQYFGAITALSCPSQHCYAVRSQQTPLPSSPPAFLQPRGPPASVANRPASTRLKKTGSTCLCSAPPQRGGLPNFF